MLRSSLATVLLLLVQIDTGSAIDMGCTAANPCRSGLSCVPDSGSGCPSSAAGTTDLATAYAAVAAAGTTTPATADASGSDNAASTAVTCGDDDAICALMTPYLPGSCSCSGTNGGSGSFTECQESFPGLGSFGVRVELEPCDCGGAYAEVSYKAGGDWTIAGRLAAGEKKKFAIPGLTFDIPFGPTVGLYADVAISGDKSNLVIDVHLSLCIDGKCDGNIPGGVMGAYGKAVTTLGFPFALIKDFEGVDFTEQCKCAPDCSSKSSSPDIGIFVGIAIAALVVGFLLIAGCVFMCMKNKKQVASSPA